jgi:hypothetical protein
VVRYTYAPGSLSASAACVCPVAVGTPPSGRVGRGRTVWIYPVAAGERGGRDVVCAGAPTWWVGSRRPRADWRQDACGLHTRRDSCRHLSTRVWSHAQMHDVEDRRLVRGEAMRAMVHGLVGAQEFCVKPPWVLRRRRRSLTSGRNCGRTINVHRG